MADPNLPDWFWDDDDCFATAWEKARDTIREAKALAKATGEPVLLNYSKADAAVTMKLMSQFKDLPRGRK